MYADIMASRRIAIGFDESGIPVVGIPYKDRKHWDTIDVTRIVFAKSIRQLPKLPLGDYSYIGIAGSNREYHRFTLWMPVQNHQVLSGIISQSIKQKARFGTARLVCFSQTNGKVEWMANEDIAVTDLCLSIGDYLTPDLAWDLPQYRPPQPKPRDPAAVSVVPAKKSKPKVAVKTGDRQKNKSSSANVVKTGKNTSTNKANFSHEGTGTRKTSTTKPRSRSNSKPSVGRSAGKSTKKKPDWY